MPLAAGFPMVPGEDRKAGSAITSESFSANVKGAADAVGSSTWKHSEVSAGGLWPHQGRSGHRSQVSIQRNVLSNNDLMALGRAAFADRRTAEVSGIALALHCIAWSPSSDLCQPGQPRSDSPTKSRCGPLSEKTQAPALGRTWNKAGLWVKQTRCTVSCPSFIVIGRDQKFARPGWRRLAVEVGRLACMQF